MRTDFVLLQQALMNLLANASVHTEPGTSIELRVWREGFGFFCQSLTVVLESTPQLLPRVFGKILPWSCQPQQEGLDWACRS